MSVITVEKNNYTAEPMYQWDLNQVLEIYGLSMPAVPEVHFTNDIMVRAVRRFATMDAAGVIRVEVPNALLQTAARIKALVCIREGEVFKTYHEIRIPVKARQQPADYTITDDQDLYSFVELENLVYESVAAMQQSTATANEAKAIATAAKATAESVAGTTDEAKAIATAAKATADAAAKDAKDAAAAAATFHAQAVLPASDWIGEAAPYTLALSVPGILETDRPHIAPLFPSDLSVALTQREAWSLVCDVESEADQLTFTCFEEKPAVAISVQIEVNR